MPNPENDLELPGKPRRRPSHVRKKRPDTTKIVRPAREHTRPASEARHVVPSPDARQEQWSDVANPAPSLPDPVLRRPVPPPAPLPSESLPDEPTTPGWLEDRQRRKRIEDIVGTVVLAIMVAAMLATMWLRMTGP